MWFVLTHLCLMRTIRSRLGKEKHQVILEGKYPADIVPSNVTWKELLQRLIIRVASLMHWCLHELCSSSSCRSLQCEEQLPWGRTPAPKPGAPPTSRSQLTASRMSQPRRRQPRTPYPLLMAVSGIGQQLKPRLRLARAPLALKKEREREQIKSTFIIWCKSSCITRVGAPVARYYLFLLERL